ncbi:acyl--CoA ligase [Amycolatopsis acidiphila]|uniref:class I adenylate-forming enzyme family protein n=1 Tax=Amycolatopsis acidiphila TaxID=715473 RepID=UPI0019CA5E58|nr:class I adenylate-forming enzyme family protein [Amycolatopsis acidiphila]UIJ63308.1 acyl--CoA ligase [Amycolatopsis acidiphila]GHG74937.1 AMP-binding protein [Amycolatopsis acidiphila]
MPKVRAAAQDSSLEVASLPPQVRTIPELIDARAAGTPDAEALVAGGTRSTYAELAADSHVAAGVLAELGVTESAVVGLMAPNVPEWVPAAVGAMRLGARVDAFNTWAKAYDLDFLLGSSAASVLVLADRVRGADLIAELRSLVPEIDRPGPLRSSRFPALRHVVVLGEDVPAGAHSWQRLVAEHTGRAPAVAPPGRGDAPAYVLYTSGSTSKPKAVPLCHRDLVVNGFHIGERMGLRETDRVWFGSPLFWSYGCANALMATFTHGACFVLQEQFTAAATAELMARERVTAAYLLPTMIDALVAEAAQEIRAVTSLRTGLTIGRPDAVDKAAGPLGIEGICNVYGSTETYGNCCVTDHRMPLERRRITQGRPLPGVEIRIVDEETGTVLPAGEPGEAQVRGRLTPGYLGDDAATAAAFTADGWFRTGDRLVVHADGAVAFVDRSTDMIKTSGINVSPAEVESFLTDHPGVAGILVVGAPHPTKDEVVVAFVVPADDGVTEEDLIRYCKKNIAGYKVPWLVSLVGELPRTGTGKLVRRGLRARAQELVDARLAVGS